LFSLAHVLLKHLEESRAEQVQVLNGIESQDVLELSSIQNDTGGGNSYYNQAITIAFTAGRQASNMIRCLELLANGMIQNPSSARFGYAFAIIHKRCKEVERADTLAIQVWEGIERTTVNQFFRRVVANAYRRKGEIMDAFETFAPELEAPFWHPDLVAVLDDAWSQRNIDDVISSWHF
jgi:hypothetical protein